MSYTIKDYECICHECGRIWENAFCYKCGIRLDGKERDEIAEDPIYDDEYEEIEDVDDLWDDEITDGDIDYYYDRYSK